MAGRPPKTKIDYAGWSVDIFDTDSKIDKLLDAQKWKGFGVYFFLCQRAYGSDGYFYKWSYDDCASTARKMGGGIRSGTVKETVDYCLRIGLFDKGLFVRWGILTSRGIQKRYCIAIKDRDVKRVIADYWLLSEQETEEHCKGLLKLPLDSDLSEINTNFPAGNTNNPKRNTNFTIQKESKEKNSKRNNMISLEEAKPIIEKVITLLNYSLGTNYREDDEKTCDLIRGLLSKGYTQADMECVVKKKCTEWKNTEQASWLKPATLFGTNFDGYLNQPQAVKKPRTKFHNFQQHSYDFGVLEDKLFINNQGDL